jgi:hypothetical protein
MQNRPQSRRRKALFVFLAMLFATLIGEFAAFVGLHWLDAGFRFSNLREQQKWIAQGATVSPGSSNVIHPYLGWVIDPDHPTVTELDSRNVVPNRFGFLYDDAPLPPRSPAHLTIAVTGGSVAWQFLLSNDTWLKDQLSRPEWMAGTDIRFLCLASSGYKQPQQLLATNYFLSMGADIDLLINIDGYNELAFGVCDNFENSTSISYPAGWHVRSVDIVDPTRAELQDDILKLRARRQRAARRILKSPFRMSCLRTLFWLYGDQRARTTLRNLNAQVMQKNARSFRSHGPRDIPTSQTDAVDVAIHLWSTSSKLLHGVCHENDMGYLHVLQPNQYLSGTKRLTATEKSMIAQAGMFETERGEIIARYYHRLCLAGAQLSKSGVAFIDLTNLFQADSRTVYRDGCCHLTAGGYRTMAKRILPDILEQLQTLVSRNRSAPPSL